VHGLARSAEKNIGPKVQANEIVIYAREHGRPIGYTKVYPKVSGLSAWNENRKCYGSLPLGAVVSLFCE